MSKKTQSQVVFHW